MGLALGIRSHTAKAMGTVDKVVRGFDPRRSQ